MPFKLGKRSRDNLAGVNMALVMVVERAISITGVDFVVIEGRRTIERQRQLVASGASRTMNSRHLTGHAVDLAAIFEGKVTWHSGVYARLAPFVKAAAADVGVPIEWGFDLWKWDMPHWQLPKRQFP